MRLGIAGYGLAGEQLHAPFAQVAGLEVAAIVTGDAERATRAREAFPFALVRPSVEEVWDAIDVLVVASPNRTHVPLALAAIEHGKGVVVDKPLAPTAADARKIVDAARDAGVLLTVFQNRRWDADFLTAQRLVGEGGLGQVLRFESRFERFRPEIKTGWRELGDPAEGGGTLLDLGAHLVDQARVLFGHPVRVYAEVERRRDGAQVDDDAFLALEHPGGVRSHLWMSAVAPLAGPRLAVSGLDGGFEVHGLDPQELHLRDGRRPGEPGFGRPDRPGRLVTVEGDRDQPLDVGSYAAFYEAVGRGEVPVDPADAVAVLEVLEAARRSADEQRVVEP